MPYAKNPTLRGERGACEFTMKAVLSGLDNPCGQWYNNKKTIERRENMADNMNKITEEVEGAFKDVRDEAQEVAQEARAAIRGERLESANTPGGAGYRASNNTSNGGAVASLVLGILSIICSFFGYSSILGLILGIIGVVLGAKARKISQTGIATGGFVCSLIGLIFSGIGLICTIALVGAIGSLGYSF